MRGAMPKAMSWESGRFISEQEILSNSRTPACFVWARYRSPSLANIRVPPSKGTQSATDDMAAYWLKSSSSFSILLSAHPERAASDQANNMARPVPQKCGDQTANASARSWMRWWSMTTASIPNRRANSTAGRALIPLSTVITRFVPLRENVCTAGVARP